MVRAGRFLLVASALASAGCDDNIFDPSWLAQPDTVVLYSLARPELELESAFQFLGRATVQLERPGAAAQWDIALDTRGGQLVLLTPGALVVNSRARIAALPGQTFDLVTEAPADTLLYTGTDAVPVQMNAVYVVRTRIDEQGCSKYAKVAPVAIDVAEGRLRFVYDTNPLCNDRRLVAPDTL
jgi:hypothetical protein